MRYLIQYHPVRTYLSVAGPLASAPLSPEVSHGIISKYVCFTPGRLQVDSEHPSHASIKHTFQVLSHVPKVCINKIQAKKIYVIFICLKKKRLILILNPEVPIPSYVFQRNHPPKSGTNCDQAYLQKSTSVFVNFTLARINLVMQLTIKLGLKYNTREKN